MDYYSLTQRNVEMNFLVGQSRVLVTKDWSRWDWNAIHHIVKGPLQVGGLLFISYWSGITTYSSITPHSRVMHCFCSSMFAAYISPEYVCFPPPAKS